jgi:uncharacterized protein (TIGR02391 family)
VISFFENVVRRAHLFSDEEIRLESVSHPFDERNIHPKLPAIVRELFDDGYNAQSTFEAFKFLENQVVRLAKVNSNGYKLMMAAFNDQQPLIQLTPLLTVSEKDEQRGYQFIFAGTVMAIRNPRGHGTMIDSLEECLDHLSLASLLLRRLEQSGFPVYP